jgi:PAS domain S-box-containing protein
VDETANAEALFAGPGEMRALHRATDWSATPLGAVARWPAALRTAVRLMLDAPVATSLWCGPAYTLLYNDAYRPILGVKHPTALARSGAEVWAELWPTLEEQFEGVRAGGPPVFAAEALLTMERLEGGRAEDTWFTYALSALTDETRDGRPGEVLAVYNVAIESTARVRADRSVAVAQARLEQVFSRAPSFIVTFRGPDQVYEFVNEAYYQLVGHRDILGKPLLEALPEIRDQGFLELLEQVRQTGEPRVFRETPVRLQRTPGAPEETRYLDMVFQALADADGTRSGVVAHGSDVTEQVLARREVERLLAESERARADAEAARTRSEAVLASIADAFYLLDREWRFIYVNDAAEPLLQTTRDALLGRTLWEAFPGVTGSHFEGPYREAMSTGRPTSAEAYFEPLGTWFDVHSYPWSGGLMVHFRDIGARKAADEERERLLADAQSARREAETANRAKAEFLATMSHELRTPLNAIGGYAELMEMGIRGPVTPQQIEDLRRIQASQLHLLGLVNEVLNYARIETGTVRYDVEDVPLAAVIASVEPLVAPQLAARGLAYSTACDPTPVARADREKMRQVLLNLLSNAVKFTEPGGRVEVSCATRGDVVDVVVRDTGVGIEAEELERVFEPFVQVNATLTRTHEGTGLGLAISRDLARGMGGDLTVQSTPGVGSAFTLTLPKA